MVAVYVLHHVRSGDEFGDEAKLIAVYRSAEAAAAAATRLMNQPGFRDRPTGFYTDAYPINRDQWCERFISGE